MRFRAKDPLHNNAHHCRVNRSAFFVYTFLPALLRESEGFKLACRLQLVYWWAKNCPFTLVSIAPLPARPGDAPYTLARTFVSVRERVGVTGRETRRSYVLLVETPAFLSSIRPRVHTLSVRDPRSCSANVSVGTALNYRNVSPLHFYLSLSLFWRRVSTNASF